MSFWNEFPKWVKVYTIAIGLPAWLVWCYPIVTRDEIDPMIASIAFGAFASAVVLQIGFIARSFIRGDI